MREANQSDNRNQGQNKGPLVYSCYSCQLIHRGLGKKPNCPNCGKALKGTRKNI